MHSKIPLTSSGRVSTSQPACETLTSSAQSTNPGQHGVFWFIYTEQNSILSEGLTFPLSLFLSCRAIDRWLDICAWETVLTIVGTHCNIRSGCLTGVRDMNTFLKRNKGHPMNGSYLYPMKLEVWVLDDKRKRWTIFSHVLGENASRLHLIVILLNMCIHCHMPDISPTPVSHGFHCYSACALYYSSQQQNVWRVEKNSWEIFQGSTAGLWRAVAAAVCLEKAAF